MKSLIFLCTIHLLMATVSFSKEAEIISAPIPAQATLLLQNYTHIVNPWGNLFIEGQDTPTFVRDVREIKDIITKNWDKRGILIALPLTLGKFDVALKSLGFELYDLDKDNRHLVYLYRNNRAIPNVSNSFLAACVFILRKNPSTNKIELLIVNEYDKKYLTVPGGATDDLEFVANTAIREVKEEVGVTLKKEDIQILALRNILLPELNKNCLVTCFKTQVPFHTLVNIDNQEIIQHAWVPLNEIVKEEFQLWGKPLLPLYRSILQEDKKSRQFIPSQNNNEMVLKFYPVLA